MACKLCQKGYPMFGGSHYDEGGFLPCEDRPVLNKDQATHDKDELHRDALKALIREALKSGPGLAKELARRAGVPHGKDFVRALHDMEDEGRISFNWIRGYRNE